MNNSLKIRFLAHSRIKSHRDRVERSRQIVANMLEQCNNPYIALSGGKDSTCVANLVWEKAPKIPAVYFDAHCAFPEITKYLDDREQEGYRLIRFQCKPFLEILRDFGGLHSDAIEEATMRYTVYEPVQKLYHAFSFDGVYLGIRKEESYGRSRMVTKHGELFGRKSDGRWECNPIAHWSFADVWAYIMAHNIPYCAAYDKLFELGLPEEDCRISYWAGETKRRWGRYEALKRGWPDLWRKLCDEIPEARHYG